MRLGFRKGDIVRMGRRHVVHDGHGDGALRRGAVHVRHGHGKIVGNLRIPFGLITMLRGVVVQRVGERQLARGRVESRHRQDAFVRGNVAVHRDGRESAVYDHLLAADDDGVHAVRRVDVHRTFGRGRLVAGGGAVAKAGFVHRHHFRFRRRVGRRHHDAVVHAVDGDGHLAFGNVAVRIRIGVGEFFRQRLAIGKRLHRLIVVIERVAVGAVGVQRDFAILAALVRIPGEGCIGVRTGHRAFQRVARDGIAVPFRHAVREALDGRHVVHHVHGDGRTAAVTVRIRHRHRQVMGDLRIRSRIALVVFRGVPVECVVEVQPARGRIIAGHGQGTFIRGNRVARERAVFKHGHVADDNGRHAVRGVDDQGSSGRDRSVGRAGSRAIGKAGFMDRHHFRSRIAIERSHSHAVIHPAIALIPGTGLHRVCGKLYTAVEADVQATQMVDAIQQVTAAIFVITAAARGTAAGSGTGSGHQVFAKGREEVLPADLHAVHLERRHLFLGIRGVEILQLDGSAILERQDEVVAAAGQRRGIRRKVKDEAPVRSAGDGLRGTSSRLGKTDIGHEGPPEKKWYLSKNR